MDSQQELSPPSTISTQQTTMNLQDLQSYLVTFNKEIEPSDQNAFQVFCSSKYLVFEIFFFFNDFDSSHAMKTWKPVPLQKLEIHRPKTGSVILGSILNGYIF